MTGSYRSLQLGHILAIVNRWGPLLPPSMKVPPLYACVAAGTGPPIWAPLACGLPLNFRWTYANAGTEKLISHVRASAKGGRAGIYASPVSLA